MGRLFDDANPDWLSGLPARTVAPVSFHAQVNSDDDTNFQIPVALNNSLSSNNYIYMAGHGGFPVYACLRDNVSGDICAFTTASPVQDADETWQAIQVSGSSRRSYLNGQNEGTSAVVVGDPVGINTTIIGTSQDLTPTAPFSGVIANVAMWEVAITEEDCFALGAGGWPPYQQPQDQVFFCPLDGAMSPEPDVYGIKMALNGSPVHAETKPLGPRPGAMY